MDGDLDPWDRGDFVLWRTDTGYWELHDPDGAQIPVEGFGLFGTVRRRDRAEAQQRAAAVITAITGRAVTGWDEDHDGFGDVSYTACLTQP